MDNDNKIENSENIGSSSKTRKPRKSAEQKAKESILAAAEEVIAKESSVEQISVPATYGQGQDVVHQQVSVLLESELTRISNDDMKKSFDMETEYAKAKNNSLKFAWKTMWSRLFLCVMVVAAITVILTIIVNHSNKRIPVNVKGFDNVKLTELLDDVDKIESQINEAETQKSKYENKRSDEIQKVEDTYTAEKERIEKTYAQEKKNAEKKFAQESKKLESKQTTGWMEGRAKNKDIEKNKIKYDEALASAKKKREDALAISKNKYRNDLAQAKNLYKTEINDCLNTINRLKEDRYRFDNDKVQLEAEYDGKLKDRDILHKRELDDMQKEFNEKFLQQKKEYERRLEEAGKKLEDTIAEDLDRENKHVEDTINAYDPALLKDNRTKKIVKSAGTTDYVAANGDRVGYGPNEGASESFKKSLKTQKEYYDDLSYLASVYNQFPHKENRAVLTYVKAMKSLASKAGNEIYASSVNEVNRMIEEKKAVVNEKNNLQYNFNKILESMCQEKSGTIAPDAVVASISEKVYNVYVSEGKRNFFTREANRGKLFPCSLYRGGIKIATARVEFKEYGKYYLSNIAVVENNKVNVGDRILLEEPYVQ
ncbi:hypothetical protein [Treponema sp.]|uniref:hypothetical protein n=1 Tax=Treponema sp. TaxID=166 RepID=UPI00298EC5FE|nr:hypothetical protein [Treponema sp.]MCQ2240374.1 hypothetical protein [Treponema sp.]